MSEWTDQINNHSIHDTLRAIRSTIESALSDGHKHDFSTTERLERLRQVISDLQSRVDSIDPVLVPLQVLNSLQAPLQKIAAELDAFQSNAQPAHINTAHNQLENVLVHSSNIPLPRTVSDVEGIREAVTSLRRSIGQNVRHLEEQSSTTRNSLENLLSQMTSLDAKMAQSQERVEQALSDLQGRFASAEEKRASDYKAGESERARLSKELREAKSEEWDAIIQERQDEYTALYETFERGFEAQKAALSEGSSMILSDLERRKSEAERLVGIITDTGMVGGYQKEANTSKRAATVWRLLAAASLIGLIAFALIVFYQSREGGPVVSWPLVGWRVFVATAFGLLAAYAALQADRHERTKNRARKMELELAAISPYLQDLPTEKQIELKVQLAQKLFGHAEGTVMDIDKKHTGSVMDLLRMAMESIKSLSAK